MEQKNLARDGGMPYFKPLTDPSEDQKQHDKIVAEAKELEEKEPETNKESSPLDVT